MAIVSSALLIHAQKLPVSPLAAPGGALVSDIPCGGCSVSAAEARRFGLSAEDVI